jgi:superfamily II DNA or RNA helicase
MFNLPTLREYQLKADLQIDHAITNLGKHSICLQIPTGGGKGAMAVNRVGRSVERGQRCLFIVNRIELVRDMTRRLSQARIPYGVLMSDQTRDLDAPVVVASIDTLRRRADRPTAQLVVIDEAHTALSDASIDIVNHYRGPDKKQAVILGMTATPMGPDGKGLHPSRTT